MLLFEEYGVDNCKCELIEEFPTTNREELLKREGFYITNSINCLNKCLAGRTKKEYYEDTRDHHLEVKRNHRIENIDAYKTKDKTYQEENKYKIKERKHRHYLENRDKILENNSKYRELNRDKIRQQQRDHYQQNKDEINRRRRENKQANQ